MPGLYSFTIDARRDFVHMEIFGFFSPEDVCAFDADRREAYKALQCAPNQHVTLVDMTGAQIQSQDAVTAFSRSLADRGTQSRRIAFVISRSLARLQVKRAAGSIDAGFFHTIEEAKAWLFEEPWRCDAFTPSEAA